jgi:hypothetical protein
LATAISWENPKLKTNNNKINLFIYQGNCMTSN